MDVLRCRTVDGVTKELLMYVVVYNLVRHVMRTAARKQKVPLGRISFIDAVRWLAAAVNGVVGGQLRVVPQRPGRFEPRVVKRRPKQYPRLNQPRAVLRKRSKAKQLAA